VLRFYLAQLDAIAKKRSTLLTEWRIVVLIEEALGSCWHTATKRSHCLNGLRPQPPPGN
jgi:hypothetical protein